MHEIILPKIWSERKFRVFYCFLRDHVQLVPLLFYKGLFSVCKRTLIWGFFFSGIALFSQQFVFHLPKPDISGCTVIFWMSLTLIRSEPEPPTLTVASFPLFLWKQEPVCLAEARQCVICQQRPFFRTYFLLLVEDFTRAQHLKLAYETGSCLSDRRVLGIGLKIV